MTPRLSIDALHLATRSGTDLVQSASFDVPAGDRIALVGESGSGKSLTLLSVAGLLPPGVRQMAGRIRLDGRVLDELSTTQRRSHCGLDIGMVFQEPMTALNPVLRIKAQLVEVRARRKGADAGVGWCITALREMALPDPEALLRVWPHQLSGGMRQRVLVAMALAAEPGLVLADEPTTALDPVTRRIVLDRLSLAATRGAGVLLVTHDLTSVAHWADHVVVMRSGHICERGPANLVLDHPAHPYTRGLLACAPTIMGHGRLPELEATVDQPALQREVVSGSVPWWPGRSRYRLFELGDGHGIGVSAEP